MPITFCTVSAAIRVGPVEHPACAGTPAYVMHDVRMVHIVSAIEEIAYFGAVANILGQYKRFIGARRDRCVEGRRRIPH